MKYTSLNNCKCKKLLVIKYEEGKCPVKRARTSFGVHQMAFALACLAHGVVLFIDEDAPLGEELLLGRIYACRKAACDRFPEPLGRLSHQRHSARINC